MRKLILLTIIILVVFYVPIFVLSEEQKPIEKELTNNLIQAKTLDEFEQAMVKVQEYRSEIITSLIRMLRNETDMEKKIRICYLLGEYRATEAILDLSKIITFEAQLLESGDEPPRWFKYPAQDALVKCGTPSIPYMITNIESGDNELIQKLSTEVIWQVMGGGLSRVLDGKDYARMIIEKRMNEETDSVKKERLKSSLKFLK